MLKVIQTVLVVTKLITNYLKQELMQLETYLVENGFPADMMTAKGFGSANPIGDNKTSKGRQQNRRVEIFSEVR